MHHEEETPEAPEFVTDRAGKEVRVGDRIAYAVAHFSSAVLRLGTVERIYHQELRPATRHTLKLRVQPDESKWSHEEGKPRASFIHTHEKNFVKLS